VSRPSGPGPVPPAFLGNRAPGKGQTLIAKERSEPTQSERLIDYVEGSELFHTPDGTAHATIWVTDHWETWPVKSRRFSQWLRQAFYHETGRAPSAQALVDAGATIEARAVFDGPEYRVFIRIAEHDGAVYLDLGNPKWEVAEITVADWRVISDPPVKFVRKDNAAALPRPVRGGGVADLRPFLNVWSDEDLVLLVAWMIGALNPRGPYPALVLQGEQGSAKSTAVRVLRSLVDPAVEPLRAPPRDERDLALAASGNWTPALDNLSGIRPWLSDALCRLATGGGFATRELYSDDREVIFSQKRPVILNGIDSLAVAGDLRDRSVIIELPSIPPAKKRTEREFYRELEAVRPKVLGALLDAVSCALLNVDMVKLEERPRMADFAVWVAAAEEALPWERGGFMAAYTGNRAEANELALDNDPVAVAVRQLLEDRDEWSGTSTELLAKLAELVDEDTGRSSAWPKAPNALSNRMKRLAPALREDGIDYEDARLPGGGRRRVKRLRRKKLAATDRPDRPEFKVEAANGGVSAGTVPLYSGPSRDDGDENTIPGGTPVDPPVGDDGDSRDDEIQPDSTKVECGHGYPGGKGCYLCDQEHAYRHKPEIPLPGGKGKIGAW